MEFQTYEYALARQGSVCVRATWHWADAGHKNAVVELHWTAEGERVVSASSDKSVRAWDATTGNQVKKMAEHDNFVNSCCPLKRGPPLIVSGSDDGTAKVIPAESVHRGRRSG